MSAQDLVFEPLDSGEALVSTAISKVTAQDDTTIVLLAGPIKSGKTTVIVSLYELFNQGPVGGFFFGGSETLVAFERISHTGRMASGRSIPETVRTNPSSPTAFLHLRVVGTGEGSPKASNLLLSDVTGEAFEEARNVSEPTIIPRRLWRRADAICVLLDGEKLSSVTTRHLARTGARSLLRAAREANLISSRCRLMLVTTKWDLVSSNETVEFVGETESWLLDQFRADFESAASHRIAARPHSSRVPYAYGVPDLLVDWIAKPQLKVPIVAPNPTSSGMSSFAQVFWHQQRELVAGVLNVV
jgi:hypothetical protein